MNKFKRQLLKKSIPSLVKEKSLEDVFVDAVNSQKKKGLDIEVPALMELLEIFKEYLEEEVENG